MSECPLLHGLPTFNACCNGLSALFILRGWLAIRKKRIIPHRNSMITAFAFSTLFLIGYLTRFALTGATPFSGGAAMRKVYLAILISHSILAVINVPLVITSLILGLRNRIEKHRRWARVTLPIWLYVSCTGVLIYYLLYHWG